MQKLEGAGDYISWKRSFEIQLSSKRKSGFVNGTVTRSTTDDTEALQWDNCNNQVISWIHNNVCENIKKSILFISTASDIWSQLEKRFCLTNGSRKYKLNRVLYEMKQNNLSLAEYFTCPGSLWEELDSMNLLHVVTSPTVEVTKSLKAIVVIKEESRLF